ncbi:hypothetical protein NliqN6_2349 [Naganishia liquefaciens]|uniref:Uncharacterized protein n=1 Tax=Naganishia liquefaciens TaxID=104408 RepID=A0A8H3YF71_9TREE|nr:hypothetical protein NliqN6_2349 [Naganishia liquefaciens]
MPNATATEGESQENEGESLSHEEASCSQEQTNKSDSSGREHSWRPTTSDKQAAPRGGRASQRTRRENEQINDLVLLGATAGISIAATSAYFVYSSGSIPDWVNEVLTATGTATLLVISAETALWTEPSAGSVITEDNTSLNTAQEPDIVPLQAPPDVDQAMTGEEENA